MKVPSTGDFAEMGRSMLRPYWLMLDAYCVRHGRAPRLTHLCLSGRPVVLGRLLFLRRLVVALRLAAVLLRLLLLQLLLLLVVFLFQLLKLLLLLLLRLLHGGWIGFLVLQLLVFLYLLLFDFLALQILLLTEIVQLLLMLLLQLGVSRRVAVTAARRGRAIGADSLIAVGRSVVGRIIGTVGVIGDVAAARLPRPLRLDGRDSARGGRYAHIRARLRVICGQLVVLGSR